MFIQNYGETKEKEFLTSMSERIKETLSRVIQTKDEPKVKVQTKIEPETEPLTTTIKVEPAQEIKVEAKPKAKRRLFKPKVDLIALGKEFLETLFFRDSNG